MRAATALAARAITMWRRNGSSRPSSTPTTEIAPAPSVMALPAIQCGVHVSTGQPMARTKERRSTASASQRAPYRPAAARSAAEAAATVARVHGFMAHSVPWFGPVELWGPEVTMADLLVLTASAQGAAAVLPALDLLGHRVRVLPPEPSAMVDALDADVVIVDGRTDLASSRSTCRLVRAIGIAVPLVLVLSEGGMSVVNADWGTDDVILAAASPAELDARIRLLIGRAEAADPLDKASEFTS